MTFFAYYAESNIVCAIIFAIMLVHDLLTMNRQEKQIKYDRALVAFMLYFISDCFWAAVDSGILPKNTFSVAVTNFANYLLMAAVTYCWLDFVMAVEEVPTRNRPINRFAVLFPFIISTVALIVTYIAAPQALISDEFELQPLYAVFLVTVPSIYIAAVILYSVRKLRVEDNQLEKKTHIAVGFFPLIVIAGGLVELVFLPNTPVYCFSCTVLMLTFYIQSMDRRISTDPLTQLNNRGQLLRYISQKSDLRIEGRRTYVMMLDINYFKKINDTFGHAEGDRALVITAEALQGAAQSCNFPVFLGRYGGDEFILILHPVSENDIAGLPDEIRGRIENGCAEKGTPYVLSVGIGCDELRAGNDTFQQCQQRADHKLYLDKEYTKLESGSSADIR